VEHDQREQTCSLRGKIIKVGRSNGSFGKVSKKGGNVVRVLLVDSVVGGAKKSRLNH